MELGITINRKSRSCQAVSLIEITWLLFSALASLSILFISTATIPANPFGGLASELFLAEIAAVLAFYLIARSRSILIAAGCFIALPTIQAMLIYGYQDCFDWLFAIL